MVVAFKILSLLTIVVFVVFISDHRKKNAARPLVSAKVILCTRCCYFVPIVLWSYTIATAEFIGLVDWVTFAMAVVSTVLVAKAKIDLSIWHTWAGYYVPGGKRVRTGLYRRLSHPMYGGIIGVILAGTIFISQRLPMWVIGLTVLINLWIASFLVTVARRETQHWRQITADDHLRKIAAQGS